MDEIVVSEAVLTQDLDGEVFILQYDTGRYFSLDPVGSRIWGLLQEMRSVDAVVGQMLREFDVDESVLRRDVDALVASLREARLVSVADPR